MNLVQTIYRCSIIAIILATTSCTPKVEILWSEGEIGENGNAVHCISIKNAEHLPESWAIWCSQMPVGVKTLPGSDAEIIEYQANLHKISPLSKEKKSRLEIRYESAALKRHSWAPEGFTLQEGRKLTALNCEYDFLPLPSDGQKWYEYNASFSLTQPNQASIIPLPKYRTCPFEIKPQGWYRIEVADSVKILSLDEDGAYYAQNTLDLLRENYEGDIPPMVIEDWPDYQYRGFMLDLARNFTTKENLFRLIDILARYKVNYLQLHLSDDEGWRIEVKDIPELTKIGAHHSLFPELGIQPSYDGNAFPNRKDCLSNSFYTAEDYKEILSYAWSRRIRVIPEIDTPGHCRAAIKAMEQYEKRSGDCSMRLQDPEDDSEYYTAQGYTDNVMSVELESVYRFIEKIFDTLISYHSEAKVPLPAIHIGGDEVPKGAWKGKNLHDYFLLRVAAIAKAKGVKIAGWQEITSCQAEELRDVLFANNVWNTSGGNDYLPYRIADKGFPTIVSNVDYTYMDMAYSSNKQEIAHSWSCYTDDVKSFTIPLQPHDNVLGVQAQMFTETIRSFEDLCYDLFPKVVGVFERAWNRESVESPDEFFSKLVYFEMPYWDSKNITYHLPQPGIILKGEEIMTNSLIPEAKIVVEENDNSTVAHIEYGYMRSLDSVL